MILDIFKTSIFKTCLNNQDYYNYFMNELNNFCKTNDGVIKSNRGGFQTKNFFNEKIFNEMFFEPVNIFLNSFKIKKPYKYSKFTYWINKNSFGNYNIPHVHSPNNISGVYYLEVPEKSGKLIFQNGDNLKLISNFLNIFDDANFFNFYEIEPKKFDLILFLSNNIHYVEANFSNQDRISISFNVEIES
jgi:uncharacterized protein (TIGR02466 family)